MTIKTKLATLVLGVAFASLALAQDGKQAGPNPDFVKLDKNKDGFLSKTEAAANKKLAGVFDEADINKDGKLDEDEYLKAVSIYQRANAAQYANDGAITTKVKAALLKGEGIPSTAISVETYQGKVQLSGFVETKAQVTQAGTLAKGVSGVKSVQNNLQVK